MRISTTIEWDSQEEMEQFFAQRAVDAPTPVLTEEAPKKKRGRPRKEKAPEPEPEAAADPEPADDDDVQVVADNAALREYVTKATDANQGGSRENMTKLSEVLRGAGYKKLVEVPDEKCAEMHAKMEAAIA